MRYICLPIFYSFLMFFFFLAPYRLCASIPQGLDIDTSDIVVLISGLQLPSNLTTNYSVLVANRNSDILISGTNSFRSSQRYCFICYSNRTENSLHITEPMSRSDQVHGSTAYVVRDDENEACCSGEATFIDETNQLDTSTAKAVSDMHAAFTRMMFKHLNLELAIWK